MSPLQIYVRETQTSLSALARQAGVSPAQLSRVASGRSRPSIKLAQQLERVTAGAIRASGLLELDDHDRSENTDAKSRNAPPTVSLEQAVADARRVFADRSRPGETAADMVRAERNWEFYKAETETAESRLGLRRS